VAFLIYIAHAVVVGIVLAAVIALDVSAAAKILIGAAFGLLALLILGLNELHSVTNKVHVFARLVFISRETQRLNRRDKRPAKEILSADLQQERSDQQIENALTSGVATSHYFLYGVVLVATTLGAYFVMRAYG
jgi:hypothetical protein